MSPKLKKILSALFIVASISVVVIIAFSNPEMKNAWSAISSIELPWLGGLLLCWLAFTMFEALGTWTCLRSRGCRIGLFRVAVTSLIGMYYSNITPSAAGGQPMQVNSLRKAGIPVGYGTLAQTIRFVTNQIMICVISLVLFLMNKDFVYAQLGGAIWAVRIGWLINFASVPLVLLAAFRRDWIQKLAGKVISLGSRIRLVKNPKAAEERTAEVLETYDKALKELIHRPGEILAQVLCSTASLLGMTGSVVFTYYAFGQSGTPWIHVLTLGTLLYVSASYTPLPGASGAQEGGFLLYFNGIFKNGTIGLALLVWRFFTYYLFLIAGPIAIVVEKILLRNERRAQAAGDAPQAGGDAAQAGGSAVQGENKDA